MKKLNVKAFKTTSKTILLKVGEDCLSLKFILAMLYPPM